MAVASLNRLSPSIMTCSCSGAPAVRMEYIQHACRGHLFHTICCSISYRSVRATLAAFGALVSNAPAMTVPTEAKSPEMTWLLPL